MLARAGTVAVGLWAAAALACATVAVGVTGLAGAAYFTVAYPKRVQARFAARDA